MSAVLYLYDLTGYGGFPILSVFQRKRLLLDEELKTRLIDSALADNLVVFCGAGLSMAPPSNLPAAVDLAATCRTAYRRKFGRELPNELDNDLERLAQYFWNRNQFRNIFIQQVVPWREFKSDPNSGHEALAEFLGCGALQAVISANYDTLIEVAANRLGEPAFEACYDGDELAYSREHSPLLKLHGCAQRDKRNTIWCREQLTQPPVQNRIETSSTWLRANLVGKDLIFVGFWSDWSYLNSILESCVLPIDPRMVVLVTPDGEEILAQKAPGLWAYRGRDHVDFRHVPASGSDFLNELRIAFSRNFLNRLLIRSNPAYAHTTGNEPSGNFEFTGTWEARDLFGIRRDVTGTTKGEFPRARAPDESLVMVGVAILFLTERGAVLDGDRFRLGDHRIRAVPGFGQPISYAKSRHDWPTRPEDAQEIVICAGSTDDGGVPGDIVRGVQETNVVRTQVSRQWLTLEQAMEHFGD